jgi:hypothetical protein
MIQFGLTLDYPFQFASENGYRRTQRCQDFREKPGSNTNCWLDPVSGCLTLRPNFIDNTYKTGMHELEDFSVTEADPGWWHDVRRGGLNSGEPDAPMFTNVLGSGRDPTGIALTSVTNALPVLPGHGNTNDTLVWALASSFQLGNGVPDAGFTIHYDAVADEMLRYNNWLAVTWDLVVVHFSMEGTCRVFQYSDYSFQSYQEVYRFSFSDAGEVIGQHAQFSFVPIPTVGLLIYHSYHQRASDSASSSAQSTAVRGKVVPWNPRYDSHGNVYLFNPANVAIAINPYLQQVMGFQDVSFATSGTFVDDMFDLGYGPSVNPSTVGPIGAQTGVGSVTASLYAPDGTTAWATGSRQARVGLALTGPGTNTPFVTGYGVAFPPVFGNSSQRNPVTIYTTTEENQGGDRLLRLEWTDDERGRFDAMVTLQIWSAQAFAIAMRGDATWLLTANGYPFTGGLTVRGSWRIEMMVGRPGYYKVEVKLADMHTRLSEGHYFIENAMDGAYLIDAMNSVVGCVGFPPFGSAPPQFSQIQIPITADGRSWKWQFREGDDADQLLDILLFMGRRQDEEYLAYFDFAGSGTWQAAAKPGPNAPNGYQTWTITPYLADANAEAQVWWMSRLELMPEPPEGNYVLAEGVLNPGPHGARVPTDALQNLDSQNNPNSPDYMGRRVVVKVAEENMEDIPTLQRIGRAVFDAIATRRLKGTMETTSLQMGLAPNVLLILQDWWGYEIGRVWIKRRHVVVTDAIDAHMEFEVDSVWQGPVPR